MLFYVKPAVFCIFFSVGSFSCIAESITRIACVGDSITYGATIRDRVKNCYPMVLGGLLGEEYSVRNFGVNGATLLKKGDKPYWELEAFREVSEFNPNVVIIKLGTNDTKPQNWSKAGTEYEANLRSMITHFQKLPAKPSIYLCLPVPVYQTRWGINEKTLAADLMPTIKKVAQDAKLTVVDLYTALSGKPEMFSDKIHPNAVGAKLMAKTVFSVLRRKY